MSEVQATKLDDKNRDWIVKEVEGALRRAQQAGAGLDERSFLRGAMVAFTTVYGLVDGRLPLAPPKWVLAEQRGKSIFANDRGTRSEVGR